MDTSQTDTLAKQGIENQEISKKKTTVNYSQILGNNSIVFAAENHENTAIRQHLREQAGALKNIGITHFTLEFESSLNDKLALLNSGQEVDLSPEFKLFPDYELMIRAMAREGIKIVAVDINYQDHPRRNRNGRETEMFNNVAKILTDEPRAKIFSLFGTFHTVTQFNPEQVPSVRKRFLDLKIPTTSVFFHGGDRAPDKSLIFGPTKFDKQIITEGLDQQEFMLNNSDKSIPFDREADWVVHLPTRSVLK